MSCQKHNERSLPKQFLLLTHFVNFNWLRRTKSLIKVITNPTKCIWYYCKTRSSKYCMKYPQSGLEKSFCSICMAWRNCVQWFCVSIRSWCVVCDVWMHYYRRGPARMINLFKFVLQVIQHAQWFQYSRSWKSCYQLSRRIFIPTWRYGYKVNIWKYWMNYFLFIYPRFSSKVPHIQ